MVHMACGLGVPPSCLPHCQSIILLNAYPPDVPRSTHTHTRTRSLLVCQSHCWFSVSSLQSTVLPVFCCCLFELCRVASEGNGNGKGEGVVLSRLRDAFHSYPVKYSHLSLAWACPALSCLTLPYPACPALTCLPWPGPKSSHRQVLLNCICRCFVVVAAAAVAVLNFKPHSLLKSSSRAARECREGAGASTVRAGVSNAQKSCRFVA